jgi:hypothetical protein
MHESTPHVEPILLKRAPYLFHLSVLLAITMSIAVAGCSISSSQPTVGSLIPTPTVTPLPRTPTPTPAFLIQQTVTKFCQAVSDGNFNRAYT